MGILFTGSFLLAVLLIIIIAIAILVETENATWASIITTGFIVTICWLNWDEAWSFLSSNPLKLLMYAAGYVLCGVVWSLIKWKRYISSAANKFKEIKADFIEKVGVIGENWGKWTDTLNINRTSLNASNSHFKSDDEPVDVIRKITMKKNDKKGVIISWITYWPMSIAATLLNDPLRKIFTWIFELISGVYDRMARHEVSGLESGMNKFNEEDQKK